MDVLEREPTSGSDKECGDRDTPEAEVVWTRCDLGRADMDTPCPSIGSQGTTECCEEEPFQAPPLQTLEQEEDAAWQSLFLMEGFVDRKGNGEVESVWKAGERRAEVIAQSQVTLEQRLPGLVKALKSPNAFEQRSTERLVQLIQGSAAALEDETLTLNETRDKVLVYLQIVKGVLGVAIVIVALFLLFVL